MLPLERPDRTLERIRAGEPARGIHGQGLAVDDEVDGARPGVEGYGREGLARARGGDFEVGFARGPVCGPGVADLVQGRGFVGVVDCAPFLG